MSVHKPRASTARARIPADHTSVSVTRGGRARSVTKVMDTRQFRKLWKSKNEFLQITDKSFFIQSIEKLNGFHFVLDINECLSTPCVHGTCTNTLGSFQCSCEPGWTGALCDQGLLFNFSLFVKCYLKKIQVWFVLNLPYTMVIFQISMNVCNPPVSTDSVATLGVLTDVLVT